MTWGMGLDKCIGVKTLFIEDNGGKEFKQGKGNCGRKEGLLAKVTFKMGNLWSSLKSLKEVGILIILMSTEKLDILQFKNETKQE